MARKLAVRLYWMWRKEWDYEQGKKSLLCGQHQTFFQLFSLLSEHFVKHSRPEKGLGLLPFQG